MLRVPAGLTRVPSGGVRFVPGFWLDEMPVSNGAWRSYQKATGAAGPPWMRRVGWDDPEQPVVGVTWAEATAYARWTKRRLPTHAQWLRAMGSGPWPWGAAKLTPKHAAYGQPPNAPPAMSNRHEGRGPFGHLDLVGNNWELTAEGYAVGGFRGSREPGRHLVLELGPTEVSGGVGFRCAWR